MGRDANKYLSSEINNLKCFKFWHFWTLTTFISNVTIYQKIYLLNWLYALGSQKIFFFGLVLISYCFFHQLLNLINPWYVYFIFTWISWYSLFENYTLTTSKQNEQGQRKALIFFPLFSFHRHFSLFFILFVTLSCYFFFISNL